MSTEKAPRHDGPKTSETGAACSRVQTPNTGATVIK